MLKRDLIMIQIEELGKMIAQMVTNREGNDGADKNLELVTTVYRTLGVDQEALMTTLLEDLLDRLNREDGAGLYRMELLAKTLMEASYLDPDNRVPALRRAGEMLRYVQANDSTFSLEREALLGEIDRLLY